MLCDRCGSCAFIDQSMGLHKQIVGVGASIHTLSSVYFIKLTTRDITIYVHVVPDDLLVCGIIYGCQVGSDPGGYPTAV